MFLLLAVTSSWLFAAAVPAAEPGSVAESFAPAFTSKPDIRVMHVQADGRVVIAGTTGFPAGYRGLARYALDGSVDTTFRGIENSASDVTALAALPDGRFYITGTFLSVQGVPRPKLARLHPDGTLDRSFAPVSGPNGRIDAMAVQSDGSLVLLGFFAAVGANSQFGLARFQPNGAFDANFAPRVHSIGVHLLVDRQDRVYYSTTDGQVLRLAPNGKPDIGFATGSLADVDFSGMTFDAEQRLIVWGTLGKGSGFARPNVKRLLEDGRPGPRFPVNDTFLRAVADRILVQPDGRIVTVGLGLSQEVLRFFPDGVIDPSLKTGLDGGVAAMVLGVQGDLVLAGGFTSIGGTPQRYLARATLGPKPGQFLFTQGLPREVGEAAKVLTLKVERLGGSDGVATVDFTTDEAMAAKAGEDYSATSGQLVFAEGETEKTLQVPIIDDGVYERPKSFLIRLTAATGSYLTHKERTCIVTILDDDPRMPGVLTLSGRSVEVSEEAGAFTITVLRTGGSDESVEVSYRTRGGTAQGGSDFEVQSGTISLEHRVTSQTLTLPLVNDRFAEGTESFEIVFSDPVSGAKLGPISRCTVSITDSDLDSRADFRGQYGASVSSGLGYKGTVALKIGPTGVTTGSLVWMGRKIPFRRTFDRDGYIGFLLNMPGGGSADMRLFMGAAGSEDQVWGTIEVDGEVFQLDLSRDVYHARSNPFPGSGRYDLRYLPTEPETVAAGEGLAVVNITASGTARFAGVLGDGTRFSHSSRVGETGVIPFFVRLYKGKGTLTGRVVVVVSEAPAAVSGSATWVRPENVSLSAPAPGFTAQLGISGSPQ